MTVLVRPPGSSASVEIADDLVARYVAQGWTVAGGEPAVSDEPAEPAEKYLSQQNKAELVETASTLGLEVDEELSKKDLVELIVAARAEQK